MSEPKFIDNTEFTGRISLAINPDDKSKFNDFCAEAEYDLLIYILNAKLYDDLIADLDINNNPQTQKFIDLVNGVTYISECNNETVKYLGLRDLIRNYVFSMWRYDQYTINTQFGQIIENTENATRTTRTQMKIALKDGWNTFVRKYRDASIYINEEYIDLFPDQNDYANWEPKKFTLKGIIKTGGQTWVRPNNIKAL